MSDAPGASDVGNDGGSDGGNDGESHSNSDGAWDMSLEAGVDDPEWTFGDDSVSPMGGNGA